MQIGLELLPTTPVQELTIDEVARRAGISRSLLFHYFATKREYYTAVTRAAADLLLEHLLPPPGHAAASEQVTGMLDRYVGWVETFRETPPGVRPRCGRRRPVGRRGLRGHPGPAGRRRARGPRTCPTTRGAGSWCWPGSPSPRTWSASGPSEPTMSRAELLALLRDVLDRLAR